MSDMDAYKDIFLSESAEFIQGITEGLLALESNPDDLEPVEVVFRGAHSLKGMAAAMGYSATSDLTHKMESLMDRVRQRERVVDSPLIDLMLEAVDVVKEVIDAESSGSAYDPSGLIDRIVAATEAESTKQVAPADTESIPDKHAETNVEDAAAPSANVVETGDASRFQVTCTLEENCALKAVRAYMVIKRLSHMGTVVDTIPSGREIEDEKFEHDFAVIVDTPATAEEVCEAVRGVSEVESVTAVAVEASTEVVPAEETAGTGEDATRRAAIPKLSETQTVRIAIGHLDTMVNMVGELVILRARLQRIARDREDRELADAVEELYRVSAELQHEVMNTRMVPVGNIFNRFPRMVRDLARDLEKDVDFQMEGLDIELDRTVLDEIGDPIVHLLRNSADHGIESPAEREAAGKPARGTVVLAARRERDRVRISVSDDGRGIDCQAVWEKACSVGLVEGDARSAYTDDDVLQLTCVPGFSTAKQATKVSGRGVGMDVVKGKIEHLGGMLSINSKPGQGATFTLTLPLTLAIIQALLVDSEGQTYAIPLSAVNEVLAPEDVHVETVDGHPVMIDRDHNVVPVHYLDALLGARRDEGRMPVAGESVVLLESGEQQRALVVQALLARHEIVIKPLSKLFAGIRGVGGATVLGDGRVALIIDPRTVFPRREEAL